MKSTTRQRVRKKLLNVANALCDVECSLRNLPPPASERRKLLSLRNELSKHLCEAWFD